MYPKWLLYDKVDKIGIQQISLKSSADADTDPSAGQFPTEPWNKQDETSQQMSAKAVSSSAAYPICFSAASYIQYVFKCVLKEHHWLFSLTLALFEFESLKLQKLVEKIKYPNIELWKNRFWNFHVTSSFSLSVN